MTGFWARYKRKYITERTLRKNGYYNLSESLRTKIESNKTISSNKVCDYYSWDEFCEYFTITTGIFMFVYEDIEFAIEHKKKCHYWIEKNGEVLHPNNRSEEFETPQELLDNVRLDGKSLHKIWNELRLE